MKRSKGVFLAVLAAGAMLAACNNNNNNGGGNPPPVTSCGNPPNSMQVLYPKPGARRISATLGGVWVATQGTLPSGNQYDFQLLQSNGAVQFTVNPNTGAPLSQTGSGFATVSASSIPSPHANPTFSNPTYYVTQITSAIGPSQTVAIIWNDAGISNCTPTTQLSQFRT